MCGSEPVWATPPLSSRDMRLTRGRRQFRSFFQQPSTLLVPLDAFLAAPSASFLNLHQRTGSPKRIRPRSSVANRVGMHMYPRGFRPLGKSCCVLCLRSALEGCRCRFASCVSRQHFADCDRKMTVQQDAFVELACFRGLQLFVGSQEESPVGCA